MLSNRRRNQLRMHLSFTRLAWRKKYLVVYMHHSGLDFPIPTSTWLSHLTSCTSYIREYSSIWSTGANVQWDPMNSTIAFTAFHLHMVYAISRMVYLHFHRYQDLNVKTWPKFF